MSTSSEPYFSVATVEINPDKIEEVIQCFDEIVKATLENEPDILEYRYFRTKGKNEFVWISKYKNAEAYAVHKGSAHISEWLKKYPDDPKSCDLYVGDWIFHDMSEVEKATGFER